MDVATTLTAIMILAFIVAAIAVELITRKRESAQKPEPDPTLVQLFEDVLKAGALGSVAVEDDEERAALATAFYNLNSAQEVRLARIQEEIEERRADLFDILSRVPIDIDRINDIEERLKILYVEEERLETTIRANYWLLASKIRKSLKQGHPE